MDRTKTPRDTSIRIYRSKRDFAVTPEPAPAHPTPADPTPDPVPSKASARFVVQKHRAHRAGLHWDLRLEHGGVLWSWAVPRGPSLDPADRRMAIHVEDHPIDYADFQGAIPEGQYGAGTVETWDRGTWEPLGDPEEGMRKGNLRFVLAGRRLSGRFTLARLSRRDPRKPEGWFLIKGHDEAAREGMDADRLEQERVGLQARSAPVVVSPPKGTRKPAAPPPAPLPAPGGTARIVVARPAQAGHHKVGGVELTNADRQLWPGITKRDLAAYWQAVAPVALRDLAHRPLSVVRCPDGIGGKQQFFQKSGHGSLPVQIREGTVAKSPYLAIDDVDGLIALAQMSAIELHPWGASEADPLLPDRLVFDLDPGEGVAFGDVVQAAREVRDRLQRLGLAGFCRTTGGKGLHVVVPLIPTIGWDAAKAFCRVFAEAMAEAHPERYLAHLRIADRRGRILVDWLRNGLGATAVSSFCPRARPDATVATPLAWSEVNPKLDPRSFTLRTVPDRVARSKQDPWQGFDTAKQSIPDLAAPEQRSRPKPPPMTGPAIAKRGRSSIVFAPKPKPTR